MSCGASCRTAIDINALSPLSPSLAHSCGQPLPGPSAAPHLLRQHGLVELCTAAGYDVRSHEPPNTYFNIPRSGNNYHDGNRAKNYPAVAQSCEALYHRVLPIAQNDGFVLILGGDHSIPLGTIPAIRTARPRTGVVWVDAHADINTTATSPSGNMVSARSCRRPCRRRTCTPLTSLASLAYHSMA